MGNKTHNRYGALWKKVHKKGPLLPEEPGEFRPYQQNSPVRYIRRGKIYSISQTNVLFRAN